MAFVLGGKVFYLLEPFDGELVESGLGGLFHQVTHGDTESIRYFLPSHIGEDF